MSLTLEGGLCQTLQTSSGNPTKPPNTLRTLACIWRSGERFNKIQILQYQILGKIYKMDNLMIKYLMNDII